MIRPRRKPRRGRERDKEYLVWMAGQRCAVTGEFAVTIHHVRRFGEPKNDRRTLPLVARLHMRTHEVPGSPCIERGKRIFEAHWGIDIEAEIVRHNQRYETESGLT